MTEIRKTAGTAGSQGVYDIEQARRRSAKASRSRSADTTGITEGGRELSRALKAVEGAPETRAERIAALKQAIAEGAYDPDPREVAREMIERGF